MAGQLLRLYNDFADWWTLVSGPEDYEEEATFFRKTLDANADAPLRTVLELGCGGGNNASYLKAHYQMTLTDLSRRMLEQSQKINPECAHIQGDMRTLRLNRAFDAVFVHDAVMYIATEEDLRRTMQTAALHCRPGGLALFVPDYVRETFTEGTDWHGGDEGDRSLRYLEWRFDPDPTDTSYVTSFSFVFREQGKPLRYDHEEHLYGLFSRADWLRLLQEAGFTGRAIPDEFGRDVLLGVRR
jgi:SAM-dependent methyltransferase